MAYTALELINFSWYLSEIVSRDLEVPSEGQTTDGLSRLNALLEVSSSRMGLIPYYQEYFFNAVVGQEIYFVPNLIEAETLTFNIQQVRYSILKTTREKYFATGRVDNINSLPYQWHLERLLDGGNIYLYFLPQETYPMKLWGKFALQDVTLNTDMTTLYEPFYIEYMRYKLADYLCEYYGVDFPEPKRKRLKEYEDSIRGVSPLDLTNIKLSMFQPGAPFNYADCNLGYGWRPLG